MKILKINSGASKITSITRTEVDGIVSKLLIKYPNAEIIDRDVAYSNLPFPDDAFLQAIFHMGKLNEAQQKAVKLSDHLVDELMSSDILVIGVPMYNFGIPASLKAYFDLIARAGRTFQYAKEGYPVGLVKNKKAIVVLTSGGIPLGSPADFSKNYIATFLPFLGIKDIEYIELDENRFKFEEKRKIADEKLDSMFNQH